jgi:hypothetical protein
MQYSDSSVTLYGRRKPASLRVADHRALKVHADHCWGVYNSLVTRCGACRDPFLKSTLVRIAESHASVRAGRGG